ncbi:hypothetical protein D0856_01510 [Vibrio owensii]|nr:hypothetical protein D0856_01510 [Vibrio owensii]
MTELFLFGVFVESVILPTFDEPLTYCEQKAYSNPKARKCSVYLESKLISGAEAVLLFRLKNTAWLRPLSMVWRIW